ncbi:hypothetical protein BIV24_13210 [Streptomyces colonosanans]|uniref:Uncharacterized protein n=1 Tax=Streptomyces colonosanans TaxID=1428652 RepID=A0A1S2PG24_9ACTN|nr:hypothetical protein BIV24_13210 [Streptomyces colonosanans]
MLVLLLTTGLLSRFGVEDFSGALTFPGRITGAVLIVVAFTTLLGAAAVVDHWVWHSFPYSGLVALIGAFAALLTNILLLADILKNGDSVAYPVLVGALTAGSAWAVFAVWRTSVVIPAPKRVAAALILSSVIAIANFGYQNLYQPSQHEVRPVIKLTTGNPVTSQDHKAFSVPVDITLENRNDARFYVLGTEFHAMAQRVPLSSKDRLRQQWRADAEQWTKYQEINPLSRREIHQPGELIEAQPWLPTGQWIEANDTFSTRMVVQLPMDTPYDQVAFYASASLAHKDRVILKQIDFQGYSWRGGKVPPWMNTKETDSLIYRGRLHENNAIDEHTRVPRFVTVYWTFGAQGAGIRETITRHGSEDHTQAELVSRYGLVDVLTGPIERTLWDIKSRR